MDDIEFTKILSKAKQTSQEAFAKILNYLKPQIYYFLLSKYPAWIRDDAFQEASIRLYKYIPTFPYKEKSKLFSMFVDIANNECLRILKKKSKKDESSLEKIEEDNGLSVAIEKAFDIEAMEHRELLLKVYEYIEKKCSEIDKKRFYLKRQGFDNEEICKIVGIQSTEVQSIYQSIYRINCIARDYLKSIEYL